MFTTVDTHTAGEPTRTIIGGIPYVPGKTVSEKMLYLKKNEDWIRKILMHEPRGNSVMSGVILTEPCNVEADIGVIFIEVGGYLPMCGHDTIGVSTALIETGIVKAVEPFTFITLDTPAGLVRVKAKVENSTVKEVTFTNVPAFVFANNVEIDVIDVGTVKVDLCYGGNYYAIVQASECGLIVDSKNEKKIIELGNNIKDAVNKKIKVYHPEKPFIDKVTHVEFSDLPIHPNANLKNAVVIPPGAIDRSPCGTGTSAKMASLYAKGKLSLNELFIHESIIGTFFKGKILKETKVGEFSAIIPEITGQAYITGLNTFVIDPDDPITEGFKLG